MSKLSQHREMMRLDGCAGAQSWGKEERRDAMATMTGMRAAKEAFNERVAPALETIEENVRKARQAVLHTRHAAEDCVAGTALQVRRHPLSALAAAAGVGALGGCLIGFACGRWAHNRLHKE